MLDPMDAVPIVPGNVEMKHDSQGMLHLRLHPELKGLRARVVKLMKYDCTRKLVLDEYGTFYFRMVDGKQRLKDIAGRMAEETGKSREEVEEGVRLFTKKLMTMNMVGLKVR